MGDEIAVGLDFGTTNSAVGWVGADGAPVLASFPLPGEGRATSTFRSVLYFDRGEEGDARAARGGGPEAIARYLASEERGGRLIQSLKSFLASRLFASTSIFGASFRLEELVAPLLRPLAGGRGGGARRARGARGGRPAGALRGRRGAGGRGARARRASRAALRNAGFREVVFEYEPVGAA